MILVDKTRNIEMLSHVVRISTFLDLFSEYWTGPAFAFPSVSDSHSLTLFLDREVEFEMEVGERK